MKPTIGLKTTLIAVAIGVTVMAPIAGNRLIGWQGWVLPAGAIFIAMFYALVDVIHELYGTRDAKEVVWSAVVARLFIYLVMFPLILLLPSPKPDVLGEVAHQTLRLFLAGEIAPLVTNLLIDIPAFAWLKNKKIPGGFFARTNLSNLFSVTLGTVLFMVIAFAGVRPIEQMIIVGMVWRLGFTIVVSPLTSLLVGVVKRGTADSQGTRE